MYEYLQKPSVGKSKGTNSASDAKHTDSRSFSGLPANQSSRDGDYLLDESFHNKIFGKQGKAVINDAPGNGAEDDSRAYFSDKPAQMRASAYTSGAYDRLEQKKLSSEPVVQRMLAKKTKTKITAKVLWESIRQKLCEILPKSLQGNFMAWVKKYENENFLDPYYQPQDNNFQEMAEQFVGIMQGYLETDFEVGTLEEEILGAGGKINTKENTGGHKNVENDAVIPCVGGGFVPYRTGETFLHGKNRSKKKKYAEDRENDDAREARIVKRHGFALNAFEVFSLLRENGMVTASMVLFSFVQTNKIST